MQILKETGGVDDEDFQLITQHSEVSQAFVSFLAHHDDGRQLLQDLLDGKDLTEGSPSKQVIDVAFNYKLENMVSSSVHVYRRHTNIVFL